MNVKKFRGRRDGGSSFADLVEYISGADKTNGSVWVLNCASVETAELEMTAVAQLSTRVRDPALHLMASWQEGEEPTAEQAFEAGKIILKQLGLDEEAGYLSMIALHRDTGNFHIHIGACKVHRDTGKAKQLPWVDRELSVSARKVELAQGWATDNGLAYTGEDGRIYVRRDMNGPVIYAVDPTKDLAVEKRAVDATTGGDPDWEHHVPVNDVARSIEAHNGTTSFDTYYRETVAPAFKEAVAIGSWEAVHKVLGEHGVKIERSGGGYAVSDLEGKKGWYAKAGAAGSWARAARLDKKLGELRETAELAVPKVSYNPDAPHGKEVVMPHGMQIDPASSSVEVQRSNLRAAYRAEVLEAQGAYRSIRKQAKARMEARIRSRYKALTKSRRAFESAFWAKRRARPKRLRIPYEQGLSLLTSRAARERERVEARAKLLREAFAAKWDARRDALDRLGFPSWLRAQGQGRNKSVTEILRELAFRHSGPVIGAPADAIGQAQPVTPGQSLAGLVGLVGHALPGGPVEYRDEATGRPVLSDYGRRIVGHGSREDAIEGGLRMAREKFGKKVTIKGPIDWRKLACQKAVELGMEVVNPDSRPYWEEARLDIERQRQDRQLAAGRLAREKTLKASETRFAGFESLGEVSIGVAITPEAAEHPHRFDTTAPMSNLGGERGVNDRWDGFERRYLEIKGYEQAYNANGLQVHAEHARASAELLKARHYAKEWANIAAMAITAESRQVEQDKAQLFAEQARELECLVEGRQANMIDATSDRQSRLAQIDRLAKTSDDRRFNDAVAGDADWGLRFEYTRSTDVHVARVLLAGNMPEARVRELLRERSPMVPVAKGVSDYLDQAISAARSRETAPKRGGDGQASRPPSL